MPKNKYAAKRSASVETQTLLKAAKWRLAIGLLAFIACLLLVIVIILSNVARSDITFYGADDVYVEVFSQPDISNPTAFVSGDSIFSGTAISVKHVSGSVNTKQVASYELEYEASFGIQNKTCIKTVHVIDSELPEIALKHESGYVVNRLEDYVEEGFTATDNYDGDITNNVNVVNYVDHIVYSVKDSSGNETFVTRKIPFEDIDAPEIVMNGPAKYTVLQGREYLDMGATATDNYDGDITDKISVQGEVDINTPGKYLVTYSVSDSSENTTSVEREVTVVDVNSDKVIYLTFDDGPSLYTKDLLDILDKYNVKATFFVVHTTSSYLMKDIVERGHSIGAHTYSHNYRIYKDEPTYYQDLNKILDLIKTETGVETKLIRFPGGSSNTISLNYCKNIMTQLAHSLESKGYVYFDWSIDSCDASTAETKEAVVQNIIDGIQDTEHPIVLQHDTKAYSVEAVEDVIKWGLENGYTFASLDENSFTAHHRIYN